MHIIFLNGSEFRGSWREFTRALWHPLFILLVLGMTAVIFLVRPYDHILPEEVILRTLIVASAVVVFLAFAIFCLYRCARTRTRTYGVAVIVPANIVTSVWAVNLSVFAGGHALGAMGWVQLIAFNFVFCLVGELILASFLLRRIALETGLRAHPIAVFSQSLQPAAKQAIVSDRPEPATPPRPQQLEILGQPVALDQIWHLKAEEHYVLLSLRDGSSLLLRGRLADAIAQVPIETGLQVHRSHWVARSALADLDRKRDGWRLRLQNGADVPVARNRQTEVRSWVEAALQAS
ncbi:LytTR family DNA-binding domain-containing protein [Pseudorhodobacter ferrugineus]|uniref:LytTR family DNA-binding domain-containing protein n=1 Tax=Pseudorhodobacter ferrugineus TaxID=77008 RepID=UPI0003B5F7EC|nr:LytTR family DNA-binding domain-containing protein [Pseudorhodobacter ferrugineus]